MGHIKSIIRSFYGLYMDRKVLRLCADAKKLTESLAGKWLISQLAEYVKRS